MRACICLCVHECVKVFTSTRVRDEVQCRTEGEWKIYTFFCEINKILKFLMWLLMKIIFPSIFLTYLKKKKWVFTYWFFLSMFSFHIQRKRFSILYIILIIILFCIFYIYFDFIFRKYILWWLKFNILQTYRKFTIVKAIIFKNTKSAKY